jgi:iron complex transport system permease protein
MFRLLLVGVGINTLGGAVVAYLLTYTSAADFERLNVAQQWLLGGVSGATWGNVQLLGLVLLPVTPVVLVLGRQLNAMQLGEDLAVTLGVRVSLIQAVLAGFGALLAAVVVSVAGPIGFVAFIAPHIARRLARTSAAASLPVAMAAGGLLVLLADYAAQRVLAPTELPVGIATTVIGAPYLLYLLIKAERTQGVA